MQTAQQTISRIVMKQPEDSSYDDILKELLFKRMVDRGLQDSKEQNTITSDEMLKKINLWLH